jgi:uncharacterized protein
MRRILYPLSIALAVVATAPQSADAQSINCNDARRSAERTICYSRDLLRRDHQLNVVYDRALMKAYNPERLRVSQRRWLARRRGCGDSIGCLEHAYTRRIGELQRGDF